MTTIQTEDYGPITFPDTPPINLDGEADAYAGETFEAACKRLFYVACQCGYLISQGKTEAGPHITVYTHQYAFRLVYASKAGPLASVYREAKDGWRLMARIGHEEDAR